jgi:hypothetical protein
VHRIGAGQQPRHEAWPASWYAVFFFSASLMIIERALGAHQDLVLGASKSTIVTTFSRLFARREQRRLVHQVLEIGAR